MQVSAARECLRLHYDLQCYSDCLDSKVLYGCELVSVNGCKEARVWVDSGDVVYGDLAFVCSPQSSCHWWAHPGQLVELVGGVGVGGGDSATVITGPSRSATFKAAMGMVSSIDECIAQITAGKVFMSYWKYKPGTGAWDFEISSRATAEASNSLVGSDVVKEFGSHGIYKGKVTSYSPQTQWYRVVYEDGDQEDLLQAELLPLLV